MITKDIKENPRSEVVNISYEEGAFKLNYRTGGVYLKGINIPRGEEFPLELHLLFDKNENNLFDQPAEVLKDLPQVYGAYTWSLEPDLGEGKPPRKRLQLERSLMLFGSFGDFDNP